MVQSHPGQLRERGALCLDTRGAVLGVTSRMAWAANEGEGRNRPLKLDFKDILGNQAWLIKHTLPLLNRTSAHSFAGTFADSASGVSK